MSRLRRLAAATAVACASVPALVATSIASGAPLGTTNAPRCESCSKTSCSVATSTKPSRPRPARPVTGSGLLPRASAENTGIPGSGTAVIFSNFPTQDARFIAKWKRILVGEHYEVREDLSANAGPGSATLANFVSAVKAGVFIISTHGADLTQNGFNGLLVSEFTTQAALDAAWNADEKDPAYQGGVLRKVTFVDNHRAVKVFSLWITQKGVKQLFGESRDRPADQLVFDGACWSNNLAADFGSTAYFGYTKPSTDAEVYGDIGRLLGRLDGTLDKGTDRDTAHAWTAGGFTNTANNQLAYHAQPDDKSVALSPDVSKVEYPGGQNYSLPGTAGPFKIEFNAAMDTRVGPESFLSVKGATLSDSSWASPTELTVDLKNSGCADVCPVKLTIAGKIAVSAGDFHNWLDGNLDPAGDGAGVYPNGDDEEIPFSFASWHAETSPDPSPDCSGLYSVAVESPSDVWAVGSQGLGRCVPWGTLTEHWDGKTWATVSSDSPTGASDHLFGVTAAGPKDSWAVGFTQDTAADNGSGDALVERSDGATWTTQKLYSLGFDGELWAVSAAGPDNIWAAGYGLVSQHDFNVPLIMHDDNGNWTEMTPKVSDGGTTELLGIDAVSPTDIWATGFTTNADNTAIRAIALHSTGGAFTESDLGGTTSSSTYSQLDSISALSATDIWAVGYVDDMDPLIEHWDGKEWSDVKSGLPDDVQLQSVTAVSATSAWAVGIAYSGGSGQVIIHWDGKKWTRAVTPATKFALVYGLASSRSGYAVGVGNVNDAPFVEAFTPSTLSK